MVTQAMANGAFIGGEQVSQFEAEFAQFCGTEHCVGVNSGTDALRFALIASGVGPGDEVITVPNTFIATTEAISQVGATSVFVDVTPHTSNMDPSQIENKITDRTRAIIPVHLYGQTSDMDPILAIGRKHNLFVIEDACQAHGALYKKQKAGSMGTAGCFSFYPGKNLGACGEAGAIVTGQKHIAETVRMIRDHGQSKKYYHKMEGYNGRLDAIQAGVLRIKLERLNEWTKRRRENALLYNELLSKVPAVQIPLEPDFAESVYHLYVVHVNNRDELQDFLNKKEIQTGLHYPLPLHLQEAYAHLRYRKGAFPVAENLAERLLSLPMYPELSSEQIEYVAQCIRLAQK